MKPLFGFIKSMLRSGHAATSIGLLTYMLLEFLFHLPDLSGKTNACVRENSNVEGVNSESPSGMGMQYSFVLGYGWRNSCKATENNNLEANMLSRDDVREMFHSVSESSAPTETTLLDQWLCSTICVNPVTPQCHHYFHALLWIIFLLPVPLSRVYLHDHSVLQILTGSMVGITLGTSWYFCIIRGWLYWSGALVKNNAECMECLVSSPFGKWLELKMETR